MHRSSCLVALVSLMALSSVGATPAEAQRVLKTYKLTMDKWALEMRIATTPEDRAKAWSSRPDAAPFAREMWAAIGSNLDQDWTLEPAAWFLRTTPGLLATDKTGSALPIFSKQNSAIRDAIETYHVKSPKLTPICAALMASSDPRSLAVLEKIQATNPNKKIQGVAALGAAIQLKGLGDNAGIMQKRINYLRKAIIESVDVEVDGRTVKDLAGDELYIINNLTKGRVAPDLVGTDSAGRPLSLSTNKGKVIMLLFWNSNVADAQRVVDITTAMETKYRGKPFTVIGVNNDTTEKLRKLQADQLVNWTNFSDPDNKLAKEYRVGTWPLVYVLDGDRKIQYSGAPGSFVEFTVSALLNPEPVPPIKK